MTAQLRAAWICAWLAAIPISAVANLIDAAHGIGAGSFELQNSPYVETNPGGDFMRLPSGSTVIAGWTAGGNGVDYLREPLHAAAGVGIYSLDLAAQFAGTLSTTINTVANQQYALSFVAYGSSGGGAHSGRVSAGSLNNQLFSPGNVVSPGSATFEPFNFFFTASSNATNVFFSVAATPTGFGPVIDNVSVVATTIPLPSSLILLVPALGFLVARRQRRE